MLTTPLKDEQHETSIVKVPTGKPFVAGDQSKPSTFEACHQNEARLAAYVGYNDVAAFRTFLLSPFFLKYYLLFDTDWSKGMRAVRAFEQIRDVWLAGNIRETFSASWDDVDKYRPSTPRDETYGKLSVEDKEQTDRHLAQILILMVEEYTQAAPRVVTKEEQNWVSEKLLQLKPNVSTVPDISGRLVNLPQMKCEPPTGQKAQESDLEAYNRALNLLRHMCHIMTNSWAGRYEKDNWDRFNAIDTSYIPDFMQFKPTVVTPKYTVAEALKARNLSEKKILLSWSTPKKDNKVNEYLENNLELPFPAKTSIVGIGDPRILDCRQYRDSLRVQYRCHETGLQLRTATMTFPPTKFDKDEEEYDIFSSDWDLLCEALEKEYLVGKEVDVKVKLRLLDTGSDEPVFESTTPLPELKEMLGL